MWNKDEGDILEETLLDARSYVDELLVVDDRSRDNSWEIIKKHRDKLAYIKRYRRKKAEYPPLYWQRQHLLDKAVELFGRDIWIQIIESDMMILDTNIREAIDRSRHENCVIWFMINAARRDWIEYDLYPNWPKPIKEIMDYGYVFERTLYTFRPLPGIRFSKRWRPYPAIGWEKYRTPKNLLRNLERSIPRGKDKAPLLAHFNYRGPTHFKKKARGSYKGQIDRWLGESPILQNDTSELFPLSRLGWKIGRPNAYRWKKNIYTKDC